MSRLSKALGPAVLAFLTYIVFTGSVTGYDLVTGLLVAGIVGWLTAELMVQKPAKLISAGRFAWLLAYSLAYFLYYEVRAHLDVMRRILSPSMPINPGIVRVPYEVRTDYAMTAVANSITNTPGTVVVDLDPEGRSYFVHWIDIKAVDPEECREQISLPFERFLKRVFD